jgi:hypothetical protein
VKPKSAKAKPAPKIDWDKVAEENRQRCNTLTDEEREHYEALALRMIYGAGTKTGVEPVAAGEKVGRRR